MTVPLPAWVPPAAALPVAFAQVREDPLLDAWVADQLGPAARVMLIASGGCTAAVLATHPNVGHLHLVDPNPGQLALARLKLRLLETAPPTDRLSLIGHAPMPIGERQSRLIAAFAALGLSPDVLGDPAFVARVGPDHAGRYEQSFVALRDELAGVRDELEAVLRLADPTEQAKRVEPGTPLGRKLDEALDTALALPNLVALFGEGATRNPVEPFARHFARRIRHAFATLPAATNPFLWQMLAGRYPDDHPATWLTLPATTRLPELAFTRAFMVDASRAHPGEFDFVHLSNILDWLSPDEATETLHLAAAALRPGGWVLIRQLNSTLDIPRSGAVFDWHTNRATDLHAADRSFFYRALHLGRKR